MKMKIPNWLTLLLLFSGLLTPAAASSSTILYSGYRGVDVYGSTWNRHGIDLDGDGTNDFFTFESSVGVSVVGGIDRLSFFMGGSGENQLLLNDSGVALLSAGDEAGETPPSNVSWGGGSLLTAQESGPGVPPHWVGNLGPQCIGFVGFRMKRADGWHFG